MIQIHRILAPTDFSEHSKTSVKFACDLAEKFDAELHLLHVLADVVVPAGPDPMLIPSMPPEFYSEQENQAKQLLNEALDPSWTRPAKVVTEARWGEAVTEVVNYSKEHSIDLIVIATHGRTGLRHILLGSVAEKIVREAPCPVLTIRDKNAH